MGERIVNTVVAEFSDVADAEQITRLFVRLLLAALLGGVLGYEREHRGKAAGVRTHMLVSMGSALFVLVPQLGGMQLADMSRVIQGIVAGIGFLGAGAIIKNHSEENVQGLTTAAGVRTHMLVSMGSALFVLVPQLGGMQLADMSRVIQGIVAGIGFLGAGAIIKNHSEENVQGLTTAASVWMTAAIGIACGLGRESTAVIGTLLALAVLAVVPKLVDRSNKG